MHRCIRCGISENLFSVNLNSDGVCNYCLEKKQEYLQTNHEKEAVEDIQLKDIVGKGKYDVLLAYSGGKDSTYLLYMLREKYHLNVLTMTLNNGFLSKQTLKNIEAVTTTLDTDNIILSPSKQKLIRIFNYANQESRIPYKSLERASSICTYCIGIVKASVYEQAMIHDIPLITFGWTPGQVRPLKEIIKLQPEMLLYNQKSLRNSLIKKFGIKYGDLFLNEDFIRKNKDKVPYQFYPYTEENYNESDILNLISKLGWNLPKDTDSNSSNCVLNAYAISEHLNKYHFHPYEYELCGMVRENIMSKEEMMKRINKPLNENVIEFVQNEFERFPI